MEINMIAYNSSLAKVYTVKKEKKSLRFSAIITGAS